MRRLKKTKAVIVKRFLVAFCCTVVGGVVLFGMGAGVVCLLILLPDWGKIALVLTIVGIIGGCGYATSEDR